MLVLNKEIKSGRLLKHALERRNENGRNSNSADDRVKLFFSGLERKNYFPNHGVESTLNINIESDRADIVREETVIGPSYHGGTDVSTSGLDAASLNSMERRVN